MDYHCEVCNIFIKPKSKSKHLKSNNHKNLDQHKHIKLTINNPNIDNIDSHIKEYNKKYEYYLVRCKNIVFFLI